MLVTGKRRYAYADAVCSRFEAADKRLFNGCVSVIAFARIKLIAYSLMQLVSSEWRGRSRIQRRNESRICTTGTKKINKKLSLIRANSITNTPPLNNLLSAASSRLSRAAAYIFPSNNSCKAYRLILWLDRNNRSFFPELHVFSISFLLFVIVLNLSSPWSTSKV